MGNYFGAIRQHITLQHECPSTMIFIADYHALTTLRKPENLRQNILDAVFTYLALGLDPKLACLFRQSDVPLVHEMAWMLGCVTGVGLLERSPSYKDKSSHGHESSVGFFSYPLLMAADILLYRGNLVPVGKDQLPHLEAAQDIVTHFNSTWSTQALVRPEPLVGSDPVVMGIDGIKMSKSRGNTIPIFAHGEELRKQISKIPTRSLPLGHPLPMADCTIFNMLRMVCAPDDLGEVVDAYLSGSLDDQPFGYGHAKAMLAERIEGYFDRARSKFEYLSKYPGDALAVLNQAAPRARDIAAETLRECRQATGMR